MTKQKRLIFPIFISLLLIGAAAWGSWMWYDSNVDRSGWVTKENLRFYQDFHGNPVSGWLDIGGNRYYFNEDGTPRTGWQELDRNTYFFSGEGVMRTGWQTINGVSYYFSPEGAMRTGWVALDGSVYYLQEDGAMVTGWLTLEGNTYYFNGKGVQLFGFQEIDGNVYYLNDAGILLTGQQTIDEQIFFFGEDGVMRTGWDETEEGRRYYYEDGPMARGWTTIDEKLYYFEDDGLLYTGWLTQGEYRYYLSPEDGSAAVGPRDIDGQRYYFSPKGVEIVLVNALNPVPDYFEQTLVNVVDYHDVDQRCYDALVRMLEDCTAAGIEYNFNSAYRTIEEQTEILELRTAEHMKDYDLSYEEAREKALETVALPGTSEHHLGLAVDLLGKEAIAWLQEHCWDYGFILRYTAEKYPITGIIDEPWHFRYVGVEVAQDIKASGLCLEEYLGAEPVKPDAVVETQSGD